MADNTNPFAEAELDPVLEAELAEVPVAPTNPTATQIGEWLSMDTARIPAQELEKHVDGMADIDRVREADGIVSDETLPVEVKAKKVGELAIEMGNKNEARSVSAMAHALAAETGEELPPSLKSWEAIRQGVERNQRVVHARVQELVKKSKIKSSIHGETIRAKRAAGEDVGTGLVPFAGTVGEGVSTFLLPTYAYKLGNVLKKYVPSFNITNYVNIAEAHNAFGDIARSMQPDELDKMLVEVAETLKAEAGSLTENDFEYRHMVESLLSSVYERKGSVDNVMQTLDLLSLAVPGAGLLAKGVRAAVGGVRRGAELVTAVRGTPHIVPGTVADAATKTTAGAQKAVNALDEADGAAKLHAAGTTPEAVVGSQVVGKIDNSLDDLGRPYIEWHYLSPEYRAQLGDHIKAGFSDSLQSRMKDFKWTHDDSGANVEVMLGRTNGRGFTNLENAQKASAKELKGYKREVIEHDGQWYVKLNGRWQPGFKDITSEADLVRRHGLFLQIWGRSIAFSEHYNQMASVAARESSRAETRAHNLIRPYDRLFSWERVPVDVLLREASKRGKHFSIADTEVLGLTERQWKAYDSVVRLAQTDLEKLSFNVKFRLNQDGYRMTKVGEKEFILKPTEERVPEGAKIIDLTTGEELATGTRVPKEHKLYEIFNSDDKARIFGTSKDGVILSNLPHDMVKGIGGYHGMRRYKYGFYVQNVTDGKTVYGAVTPGEAQVLAERARIEFPGKQIEWRRANEVQDLPETFDDIERAREQGLLRNSHRKFDIVNGIDGEPLLESIEQSVQGMVRHYANNSGFARWTDVMLRKLNATYGDLLRDDAPLRLGGKIEWRKGPLLEPDRIRREELQSILWHIERTNGISKADLETPIQVLRDKLADVLYGTADRLGPRFLGAPVRHLADNVVGLSHGISSALKSVAFATYLGTNTWKQPLLQTSMIPTYISVEGGLGYALSGRFFNDFLTLSLSKVDATRPLALKRNRALVEAADNSGYEGFVSNHAYTIGSFVDTPLAHRGLLDDTIGNVVRGLKGAGFDLSVRADQRAAFLFARERFRVQNGRLPKDETEWQTVSHYMQKLALNQNRSDVLPTQRGMLALVTQFLSQEIKMSGRLLAQEAGFTAKERAAFLWNQLLIYGLEGFRAGELIDTLEAESVRDGGEPWPLEAKEIVKQGAYGALINAAFRALFPDEDLNQDGVIDEHERTSINVSGTISPAAGGVSIGVFKLGAPQLNALTDFFGWAISSHADHPFKPAGLGVLENLWDLAGLAYFGTTKSGLPAQDVVLGTTAAFFRKVPITNNTMKAYVAYKLGAIPDNKGNPKVAVTKAEAIAAVLGFTDYTSQELDQAQRALSGPYSDIDDEGLSNALKNMAQDSATHMSPLLNGFATKTLPWQTVLEALEEHSVAIETIFEGSEVTKLRYKKYFASIMAKNLKTNEKALISNYLGQLKVGKIIPGADTMEQLDQLHLPGIEAVKQAVRDQQEAGPQTKLILEGVRARARSIQ